MMAKKLTARDAFGAYIEHQIKIEKQIDRGWWSVNSCPDCHGTGKHSKKETCYTCGGSPDNYTPKEREYNARQVEF